MSSTTGPTPPSAPPVLSSSSWNIPPPATPRGTTGYQATPNSTRSQVEGIFSAYGVPTYYNSNGGTSNPEERIKSITNQIDSGQMTLDHFRRSIEAETQILGSHLPTLVRAERSAGLEYDGQLRQLREKLGILGDQQQRDTGVARQYGQYGDEALNQIYSLLGNQIGANNQATQSAFGTAATNNANAFNLAGQVTQAAQTQALNESNRAAQSLGLQGAQADPNAELISQVTQLLQQNATGAANADSVLNNMRAGHSTIGSQAMSDAGSEQAQARSGLINSVGEMVGKIMSSYGEDRTETLSNIDNIFAERGARVSELANEYAMQDADDVQEDMLNKLAAEIQRGTLSLQQSELGFQRERFAGELGLGNRQLDLDAELGRGEQGFRYAELQANTQIQRDQLNAQIRAENDPLKRSLLEAQIAEINRGPADAPDSPYQTHLRNMPGSEQGIWSQIDRQVASALAQTGMQSINGAPNRFFGSGAIDVAYRLIADRLHWGANSPTGERLRRTAQLAYGGGAYG